MKALAHCLWLALAACGGSDHTALPSTSQADTVTLQKQMQKEREKEAEVCPTDGILPQATQPDGSITLCVPGTPVTGPVADKGDSGG